MPWHFFRPEQASADCNSPTRHEHQLTCKLFLYLQGLDLDSSGRALSKPHFLARDKCTAEQEGWANQSDKKTSEFLDSVQMRGGQAFQNAGALCLASTAAAIAGNDVVKCRILSVKEAVLVGKQVPASVQACNACSPAACVISLC